MTREEAIERLEWLRMVGNHVDSVTLGKEDMPYFDMAISALREQPRWISVEEALPEPMVEIIAYDSNWNETFAAYMTRHKDWVGVVCSRKVTHWMPLPSAPTEEEV